MRRAAALTCVCLAASIAACGGESAPPTSGEPERAPPSSSASASSTELTFGVVEGVVRLAEGEEPPGYDDSPFDGPSAGQLPSECAPAHRSDRRPLILDDARGVANVAVGAMGDPSRWPRSDTPAIREIHIADCRLGPLTLTGTVGDRVRITNEMTYPFMPDIGAGYLQAVIPDSPMEVPLIQAGVREVHCGFSAPCGRAQLVVFHNPVHTVTTEGGHFRLERAPADQELTLTAYHPLLAAPATATATVAPGQTVHVEIVVHAPAAPTPGAPPATAAPPEAPAVTP